MVTSSHTSPELPKATAGKKRVFANKAKALAGIGPGTGWLHHDAILEPHKSPFAPISAPSSSPEHRPIPIGRPRFLSLFFSFLPRIPITQLLDTTSCLCSVSYLELSSSLRGYGQCGLGIEEAPMDGLEVDSTTLDPRGLSYLIHSKLHTRSHSLELSSFTTPHKCLPFFSCSGS